MQITRFSVHRPVTTTMACLILILLGWMSLNGLRVDLMPDMTWPVISVSTLYPGAGPEEIETLLTRPIEQAVGSVQGVDRLSSSSKEGASEVRVQFAWGTSLDPAIGDIRARLERLRQTLPPDVTPPYIRRFDSADQPIMYLGLTTNLPPVQATLLVENSIAPRLEQVGGVARIRVRGGARREIQVDLDRQKLEALNLSLADVVAAIRRENINQPAGDFEDGHLRLLLRSRGEFRTLDEVANTVIHHHDDTAIRIRDIGDVVDGEEERTEMTRIDGEPGLLVYVYKQSGANTVDVSDAIKRRIDEINAISTDFTLSVRLDKSDYIRESIGNVQQAALLGGGLAIVVLVFFLQSFRSTLVIAVTMPLSVLATFVLIYFNGFSLNMISFGGLALGMGLLVDNSIVVLESIFRRREEGSDRITAAIEGTSEVASAIVASTLTTLVVFLPLLFIQDQTGIILRELACVVSFSLVCSLIASLTLTPMLAAHCIKDRAPSQTGLLRRLIRYFHSLNRRVLGVFESAYSGVLNLSLRVPLLIAFVMMLGLAVTLGLTPFIGTEFLPQTDEGRLTVHTEMEPGIQLQQLDRQARRIETVLSECVPESVTTASFIGDDAEDSDEWNRAWFSVHLPPRSERDSTVEEIRKRVADSVGSVPGMSINVRVRNDQFRLFNFGTEDALAVEIRGHDQKLAQELTNRVIAVMESIPGMINVKAAQANQRPELSVRINRAKASSLGISVSDITQTLETAVRGSRATVLRQAGNEFNIVVRLKHADRSTLSNIEQVGVATPAGLIVPLKNAVAFDPDVSSVAITRMDRQRVRFVTASVEDRDLGSAVTELQQELRKLPSAEGFTLNIAGDWEQQQKSFAALQTGFLIAIVLMYMVMASQFESVGDPVLILLSLPLAAIGVITILLATETTLNVQSFIGLIMLAGIVVNNAIVLVDYMNQLRREHPDMALDDIVRKASTRRFRPIIMTTLTTVLAMLPIAFGVGDGGELQAPMARVVIGGLTSSTLITLLVIPLAWLSTRRPRGMAAATDSSDADSPAVTPELTTA